MWRFAGWVQRDRTLQSVSTKASLQRNRLWAGLCGGCSAYALVAGKGILHIYKQWFQLSLRSSVGFSSLKFIALLRAGKGDTHQHQGVSGCCPDLQPPTASFGGIQLSPLTSAQLHLPPWEAQFCLLTQKWSLALGGKFSFHHHDPVNTHKTARKLVPNGRTKKASSFYEFWKEKQKLSH